MKDKTHILTWAGSIFGSLLLIFILLITSFEIAAYSDYGFYEKEYEKYQVLDDVKMEMKDVMYVTKEMMSYLKGERENLIVDTVVDGEPRAFFNEREIAHMEDVQGLFIGGMRLRTLSVGLLILFLLIGIRKKAALGLILPKAFQYTTIGLAGLSALIAGLFASDFTKYFTIFHEMFFRNDLWLLDPETDLLINILPEGFFVDMAARIGIFFGMMLVICFAAATMLRVKGKKKK